MERDRLSLPSRGQAYGVVIGVVLGMLLAGLAFPLAFGSRTPGTFGVSELSRGQIPPGSIQAEAELGAGAGAGAGASAGTSAGASAGAAEGPSSLEGADRTRSGAVRGGTSGASTPPPETELTATDRGVTPDSISVGVLLGDPAGGGALGFDFGDFDAGAEHTAWRVFIADLNSRGILGRKIKPFYKRFNPLQPGEPEAACHDLTQDKKVFAVFSSTWFTGVNNLCVTQQNRTPLLSSVPDATKDIFEASRGYLTSTVAHYNRWAMNSVWEANNENLLKGKRIGVVASEPLRSAGTDLLAALRMLGLASTHTSRLPEQNAHAQIPGEVQQMKAKGVQVVMMVAGAVNHTAFVQNAESQLFFPQYVNAMSSSDTDVANQGMPESYNGAISYTFRRIGEWRTGWPEAAPDLACRKLYEEGTGRELARSNDDGRMGILGACDIARRFEDAANLAGVNLTRDRLTSAILSLGERENMPHHGGGSYGPDKFDGADFIRTQRWSSECRCYNIIRDFRRAHFITMP